MKRACEYFFWRDFKEAVLEDMFPNAEHIELEEDGNYNFVVEVEDEDGEITQYTSDAIGEKWYMIDDMDTVREMHCDNQGIWVIYDREVSL